MKPRNEFISVNCFDVNDANQNVYEIVKVHEKSNISGNEIIKRIISFGNITRINFSIFKNRSNKTKILYKKLIIKNISTGVLTGWK